MATDTDRTDRFRSNLRKEQTRSAGGTRDRRKIFEDTGSSTASSGTASTYSTGGAASRYNRAADRNESPSARGATSITSKFNKMSVGDDRNDGDDDQGGDTRREPEEETTTTATRRTTAKKYGSRARAAVNDDDDDDRQGDDGDDDDEEKKEDKPKKAIKKQRATDKGSRNHLRKERKDMRQKRRSTGVVIMPGQPVAAGDDEEKAVAENTARNMGESEALSAGASAQDDASSKQNEQYIEELKDELAKAHRELETLRKDNSRLKDENSALLRVVGSLSGGGR